MLRLALVCSLVAFAAACSSSSTPSATTTPAPAAADNPLCPMVAGTSITAEDTATGGALVFASTGDRDAVRARVAGWAERHNARHAAMGPLPGDDGAAAGGAMAGDDGAMAHHHHHHHGGGDSGGGGGAMQMGGDPAEWIGAHSRAEVADTDDGVRITFVTFPDQVGALQGELRMHAEHLGASGCGAR